MRHAETERKGERPLELSAPNALRAAEEPMRRSETDGRVSESENELAPAPKTGRTQVLWAPYHTMHGHGCEV